MADPNKNNELADLRISYAKASLDVADTSPDPLAQFEKWMGEAREAEILEPNAMTLATSGYSNQPTIRTVLLKGLDQRGFVFYTNYESRKAHDLTDNPKAALCFLWKELERQVQIRGHVSRLTREESEAYFKSRPPGHQIGAWASTQSKEIPDRQWMAEREAELTQKFPEGDVPLPDFWGGYVMHPAEIEFWQGRANRLHDRILYRHDGEGDWKRVRLSP